LKEVRNETRTKAQDSRKAHKYRAFKDVFLRLKAGEMALVGRFENTVWPCIYRPWDDLEDVKMRVKKTDTNFRN